ncbi:hypothetical protein I3760_01G045600 [Carya illinoinensis]|uniref:ENTH domain-containing protein n=1 Tax=Carya illinoinensis TaxID=32201 RepID=A0A8T1RLI7_CARIL|nr:putative clathrin assembly protein At4g40080 [Carya illinoinensis]KAG2724982.1 hypothetical protein I3760_01G045600 [Carya illinoinensis]KAG6666671.1 hypothetical protein CIPAW_01G048400 [Carya illinoinensis]KAG6729751.1 hypothetical protein I3842_01G046900 [Carya illinoinensis]
MGLASKTRDVVGMIKDRVSQSKAAILSKPSNLSLHLALLRATTHDPFSPADNKHIDTILSFGHSSRATAAIAIEVVMDRLQRTRDSSVALKCLLIVHHVVKHGDFILLDQLSVRPFTGGRNYLNLSNFRDNSSPVTWELSSWVRWYAQYIETILSTSRVLGYFFASSSCSIDKDKQEEKISALTNSYLLIQIVSLVGLVEEICKRPDSLHVEGNKLVNQIMGIVVEDHFSAISEVSVRVSEFRERLSGLSFGESVELVCTLRRLENCKERLFELSSSKGAMMESFWGFISEIKNGVGTEKDEGKLVITVRRGKAGESSDSGRFMHDVKYSSFRAV